MLYRKYLAAFIFLCSSAFLFSQEKKITVAAIGFYNQENLFDTIQSPGVNDFEFTPEGVKKWNGTKYWKKIENMSYAISKLAREYCPEGPAILGVSEIENRNVLEDLVRSKNLKSIGYKIVHYDSPERRGVDVALLYNPKLFTLTSSRAIKFTMPNDTSFKSRDQLLVNGLLMANLFISSFATGLPGETAKSRLATCEKRQPNCQKASSTRC